ncbi:hypothetical protein B0H13DRAFT_1917524 [Mycena leptocephala]|nr:hypothetical protein B0H13DRAFT_1917524 [Mycena leptocephala]
MAGVSNSVAPRENWGEDLDARHRWFTSTPQRVRSSAERMGWDLDKVATSVCPAWCAFQRIALDLLEYGHLGNDVEASHAAMKAQLPRHAQLEQSPPSQSKSAIDNEGAPFERRVASGYKPEKRITGILAPG